MEEEIKVFISYSWESEKVQNFARWLGNVLRKYGITAYVDVFEMYPGSNLENYMKDKISESSYVICICTESYIKKADDPNTGVGKEVKLLADLEENARVIPIVEKGDNVNLPSFLTGLFYTSLFFENPWRNENVPDLHGLLKHLLKYPDISKNEITNPIVKYFLTSNERSNKANLLERIQLMDNDEGEIEFYHKNNDGQFTFGSGEMSFQTKWSTCGNDSIYSYKLMENLEYIKELEDLNNIKTIDNLDSYLSEPVSWGREFSIGDGLIWTNTNDIVAIGLIKNVNREKSLINFKYKILNPIDNIDPLVYKDI